MRYTTIIDISASPLLYGNVNVRLVYLHLVLKSGYHDDDKDLIRMSIRRLADETGLTMSAIRHAISMLERATLLKRNGNIWFVRKWIPEQKISSRPKNNKPQKQEEGYQIWQQDNEKRHRQEAAEKKRREELAAQGKTGFMVYYEGLLKEAANGDLEAAELVKKHRKLYEAQKANFAANKG